jgi:hypothetical protein
MYRQPLPRLPNVQTTLSQHYADPNQFPWLIANEHEDLCPSPQYDREIFDKFSNSQELVQALYQVSILTVC